MGDTILDYLGWKEEEEGEGEEGGKGGLLED
jgi:hypothetical protein